MCGGGEAEKAFRDNTVSRRVTSLIPTSSHPPSHPVPCRGGESWAAGRCDGVPLWHTGRCPYPVQGRAPAGLAASGSGPVRALKLLAHSNFAARQGGGHRV